MAEHVDLQHYAVQTLWEVYAEQPVDCDHAGGRDNEVESYVVSGFHLRGVRYRLRIHWAYPNRPSIEQ